MYIGWRPFKMVETIIKKDITPNGVQSVHLPQAAGKGGGIGIHKKQLDVKLHDVTFQSFEHMQFLIKSVYHATRISIHFFL